MNGIRLFLLEDYDKVYAMWTQTEGIGLRTLDDSREGIEKFLKRNPSTSFIYEKDGEIIGVIMGSHDGRRGFIYHAVVRTDFRGQGIGRALSETVCIALKEEGIHRATLVAKKSNEAGAAFWRNLGWEDRDDLIYFNKSLDELND